MTFFALISNTVTIYILDSHIWSVSNLFLPQDIVSPPPGVDTAVLQTAPTCMCLEASTQTLRRQAGQRMKTTLFSGSSGGFILPQPPGSRSTPRVICPQSWPLCQVRDWCAALYFLYMLSFYENIQVLFKRYPVEFITTNTTRGLHVSRGICRWLNTNPANGFKLLPWSTGGSMHQQMQGRWWLLMCKQY